MICFSNKPCIFYDRLIRWAVRGEVVLSVQIFGSNFAQMRLLYRSGSYLHRWPRISVLLQMHDLIMITRFYYIIMIFESERSDWTCKFYAVDNQNLCFLLQCLFCRKCLNFCDFFFFFSFIIIDNLLSLIKEA